MNTIAWPGSTNSVPNILAAFMPDATNALYNAIPCGGGFDVSDSLNITTTNASRFDVKCKIKRPWGLRTPLTSRPENPRGTLEGAVYPDSLSILRTVATKLFTSMEGLKHKTQTGFCGLPSKKALNLSIWSWVITLGCIFASSSLFAMRSSSTFLFNRANEADPIL